MNILLIEDDAATAKAIALTLEAEGFDVRSASSGDEGFELAKLHDYDVILLDLNLPDLPGYDVLKNLRAANVQTPVLILSGISERDSKVRCLGFGADDYVTKPFHRAELVARIQAVVRRARSQVETVIHIGDLALNLSEKTACFYGMPIALTGKEYDILELLALRKGTTLSKDAFLTHLYGGINEPEGKIIDVFICKLRKKLATACDGLNYIETVWGNGYKLIDPVMLAQAA